ncbi:GH11047 [Drosophila grimshawi]|uniref:GH11047 n=1 Tax=Drosophila grimshawi TaxID=7222 RepID=B4K0N9_DROGR|nr:GH11047 [Drosophila grimshawi]
MLPATYEIWSSTYKRLLQWHQAQVHSFCRQQPNGGSSTSEEEDSFGVDDDEEKEEKLQPDCNVEIVDDDDDNDVEQVDADYLEFLQITLKHQEELRKLRAAQQTTTTTAEN